MSSCGQVGVLTLIAGRDIVIVSSNYHLLQPRVTWKRVHRDCGNKQFIIPMMKPHAILLRLLYPIQSSSTYRVDTLDKQYSIAP